MQTIKKKNRLAHRTMCFMDWAYIRVVYLVALISHIGTQLHQCVCVCVYLLKLYTLIVYTHILRGKLGKPLLYTHKCFRIVTHARAT